MKKVQQKKIGGTRLSVLGLDWDSILPLQLIENQVVLDVLDFFRIFGKMKKTPFNPKV